MTGARAGLIFALLFVAIEALQTVYFGSVFQHVNSFLFGALVLGIMSVGIILWISCKAPAQIWAAVQAPGPLAVLGLRMPLYVIVTAALAAGTVTPAGVPAAPSNRHMV